MKALLDADIYAFRAAASSENEDVWIACARVDEMVNQTLNTLETEDYELYLTGKGNFRYQVYPEYKANRKGKPRPKWEQAVKAYLVDQWEAKTINGMEADDALGINQDPTGTIICSIDKDLNQIAGWHYNFVKKEMYNLHPDQGDNFFFSQLLIGDPVDNIKGVAGIGQKKAEGLLFGKTVQEMYEIIKDLYSCEEELDMNAQCLYIWRKENDNWRNILNDTISGEIEGA